MHCMSVTVSARSDQIMHAGTVFVGQKPTLRKLGMAQDPKGKAASGVVSEGDPAGHYPCMAGPCMLPQQSP